MIDENKPERQLCKCGCGELANFGKRFIKGHHLRGDKNPMKNSEIAKQHGDKIRGGKNPAKRPEVRDKISKANVGRVGGFLGKIHTNESNIKRSKSLRDKEIDQFVIDNQGKYFCECGCGEGIIIKRRYYNVGIPKFISGHNSKGFNNSHWNGGISFEIYPKEFSIKLKKYIRDKYNNCDYISGLHKNICNNGRNCDVHHIDYNKKNNNENNFVPLSKSNHTKTSNSNRFFWKCLFQYALEYDQEYFIIEV